MQDAPDIDVILTFDVKNELRISIQRPATQTGQIERVRIARRSGCRISADVRIRVLQCRDKSECSLFCILVQVMRNRLVYIIQRDVAQNDSLGLHRPARALTRCRNASK